MQAANRELFHPGALCGTRRADADTVIPGERLYVPITCAILVLLLSVTTL